MNHPGQHRKHKLGRNYLATWYESTNVWYLLLAFVSEIASLREDNGNARPQPQLQLSLVLLYFEKLSYKLRMYTLCSSQRQNSIWLAYSFESRRFYSLLWQLQVARDSFSFMIDLFMIDLVE